jgi:carboxymethylenebutenolidase
MATTRIDMTTPSGEPFPGWLSLPAEGSGPGLVLLHDAFGMNEAMRTAADLFTAEDYVVLAPDLFGREQPHTDRDADPAGRKQSLARAGCFDLSRSVADMGAAVAALRGRPECAGKVGAIGFGLGGLLAYLAAARLPVDAALAFCPSGIDRHLDEIDQVRCPLGLHFGGRDERTPPETVAAVTRRLAGCRAGASVHVYPSAGPDFYLPGGTGYDRSSAQIAHSRVLGLLRRVLGPEYDLEALWERHLSFEFDRHDPEGTMTTMTADPVNMNVPVMSGGVGREGVLRYYREQFLGQMPADCHVVPVSRTVGSDRVVDEHLLCFTHDRVMDAMLPGVPPTGRYVELSVVVIVHFRGDKVAGEHIHWDQASLLVQVGLLDPTGLPVGGRDNARKLLDERILAEGLAKGSSR